MWLLLLQAVGLAGAPAQEEPGAAQGTIAGTVLDASTGEPIIEAGIEVAGRPLRVRTDLDGKFTITIAPGTYELRIFAPLYRGARLRNVTVRAGQVARADASLKPEGEAAVETVEVVAEARKAAEATELLQRQKAPTVSDSITAQTIQKSTDSDAAEVVTRVPAVTITQDKFVVVRGLPDRYNLAVLNGSRLPSFDPKKRVISLDIFPADFIESISVAKSFTPDLPGDWAGGLVDIRLRDFPEQLTAGVGASMSASTAVTFQDFDTYEGSGADYFGLGSDFRSLPDLFGDRPLRPRTPDTTARMRAFAGRLRNVWDVDTMTAPPNFGINASLGNRFGPVGASLAAAYGTEYKARRDEVVRSYINKGSAQAADIEVGNAFTGDRSTFETQLGAVATGGYKLSSDHQFSLRGLINRRSEDQVLQQLGGTETFGIGERLVSQRQLRYVERQLGGGQLGGEHRWPGAQVAWRTALSQTTEDEPDNRIAIYTSGEGEPFALHFQAPSTQRAFARLDEWLTDSGIDVTLPFSTRLPGTDVWAGLGGTFKTGVAYTYQERDFALRRFQYEQIGSGLDFTQSPERIFAVDNIGTEIRFRETTAASDAFRASQEVAALYGMVDLPLVRETLRLVAGARAEYSYITTAARLTESAAADARLNDLDPLPSINLVYTPRPDMNLRYAYSQTLNRPELRELAPTEFFAVFGESALRGNPRLTSSAVVSHDMRWEWFLSPLELLSASFFYKTISDPIEVFALPRTSGELFTSVNAKDGMLLGVELEGRKRLDFLVHALPDRPWRGPLAAQLRRLRLLANLSIIDSEVTLPDSFNLFGVDQKSIVTSPRRELQGQAPYLLNAAVEYEHERWGTLRLLYNTIGARIIAAGTDQVPDRQEEPRHQLDLVWTTEIAPFDVPFDLKLGAENLLNDRFAETVGSALGRRYRSGVKLSCSVGYAF